MPWLFFVFIWGVLGVFLDVIHLTMCIYFYILFKIVTTPLVLISLLVYILVVIYIESATFFYLMVNICTFASRRRQPIQKYMNTICYQRKLRDVRPRPRRRDLKRAMDIFPFLSVLDTTDADDPQDGKIRGIATIMLMRVSKAVILSRMRQLFFFKVFNMGRAYRTIGDETHPWRNIQCYEAMFIMDDAIHNRPPRMEDTDQYEFLVRTIEHDFAIEKAWDVLHTFITSHPKCPPFPFGTFLPVASSPVSAAAAIMPTAPSIDPIVPAFIPSWETGAGDSVYFMFWRVSYSMFMLLFIFYPAGYISNLTSLFR